MTTFDQKVTDRLVSHITKLTQIGLALSVEKDIKKLLEMIVDEARSLSNADGGTLYTVDKDKRNLCFEIMHNDSMGIRMGGNSGDEIQLPNVPLYDNNGEPNYANVSSYVALTGKTVNIPDVYKTDGFDFTGPREYDASTGYRSTSMLVIPLQNYENDIIGVLQLLNAKELKTNRVTFFSEVYVDLIASLASQAAVALTNTQLIQDLTNLFYAFIQSIAAAIDEKSPYTGGHITRVVELTMMIANEINQNNHGKFKNLNFNKEELEELRLAAWMHDVGKITTPEHIINKSSRLETLFDRVDSIETRFQLIKKIVENNHLKHKIEMLEKGSVRPEHLKTLDENQKKQLQLLDDELLFIKSCNKSSSFMDNDKISTIMQIAEKTYELNGKMLPYLDNNERYNLSISKGTLTPEERLVIENHATMTLKMLKHLPFPRKLKNVPTYAAGHHEKLNGSGYPQKLSGDQLPVQSRIMAIADIFEALTAKDRPYKKPMKLSQAIKIMTEMKEDNHIDPDIFDLFITTRIYNKYAAKEMHPDQVD